jgi:hypothetical protein
VLDTTLSVTASDTVVQNPHISAVHIAQNTHLAPKIAIPILQSYSRLPPPRNFLFFNLKSRHNHSHSPAFRLPYHLVQTYPTQIQRGIQYVNTKPVVIAIVTLRLYHSTTPATSRTIVYILTKPFALVSMISLPIQTCFLGLFRRQFSADSDAIFCLFVRQFSDYSRINQVVHYCLQINQVHYCSQINQVVHYCSH